MATPLLNPTPQALSAAPKLRCADERFLSTGPRSSTILGGVEAR